MSEPIIAHAYIYLGKLIQFLTDAAGPVQNEYVRRLEELSGQLTACGLNSSRSAARSIEGQTVPGDPRTGRLTRESASHYGSLMRAIDQAVGAEATGIMLLPLDVKGVSPRLRSLSTDLMLTNIQKTLYAETVRCVECGAYRSAMVMAWNLAFDRIRQWIFDKRLGDFNADLISRYTKNGSPQYSPIADYDDFFDKGAPGERIVLDIAKAASLIGGEMYDHLCQYLRFRNNYAHPTLRTISRDQTNSAVEHLIEIMLDRTFS